MSSMRWVAAWPTVPQRPSLLPRNHQFPMVSKHGFFHEASVDFSFVPRTTSWQLLEMLQHRDIESLGKRDEKWTWCSFFRMLESVSKGIVYRTYLLKAFASLFWGCNHIFPIHIPLYPHDVWFYFPPFSLVKSRCGKTQYGWSHRTAQNYWIYNDLYYQGPIIDHFLTTILLFYVPLVDWIPIEFIYETVIYRNTSVFKGNRSFDRNITQYRNKTGIFSNIVPLCSIEPPQLH